MLEGSRSLAKVMVNGGAGSAAAGRSIASGYNLGSSKLGDALDRGIGQLVDTAMDIASARLSALQTQQQLALQSLQIANSAPRTILQLFQ